MAWLVAFKNRYDEMEAKGAEWFVMASVIMSGSIKSALNLTFKSEMVSCSSINTLLALGGFPNIIAVLHNCIRTPF